MAEFYSARSWEIPPLPWTNLSPPFSRRLARVSEEKRERSFLCQLASCSPTELRSHAPAACETAAERARSRTRANKTFVDVVGATMAAGVLLGTEGLVRWCADMGGLGVTLCFETRHAKPNPCTGGYRGRKIKSGFVKEIRCLLISDLLHLAHSVSRLVPRNARDNNIQAGLREGDYIRK